MVGGGGARRRWAGVIELVIDLAAEGDDGVAALAAQLRDPRASSSSGGLVEGRSAPQVGVQPRALPATTKASRRCARGCWRGLEGTSASASRRRTARTTGSPPARSAPWRSGSRRRREEAAGQHQPDDEQRGEHPPRGQPALAAAPAWRRSARAASARPARPARATYGTRRSPGYSTSAPVGGGRPPGRRGETTPCGRCASGGLVEPGGDVDPDVDERVADADEGDDRVAARTALIVAKTAFTQVVVVGDLEGVDRPADQQVGRQ